MNESARRSLNNSRDYFLAFLNQDIFEIGVDFDGPILPPLVATSLLVLSVLGLLAKSLAFVAAFAATDFALPAAAFALAGAFFAADFALPASGSPFAMPEGGFTKITSMKQKIDENLVTLSFISLSKTLVFITDGHYPF